MDNTKPYKAYDLMTDALLGTFDQYHEAFDVFPDKAVQVIYRPSKKHKASKKFPYNG